MKRIKKPLALLLVLLVSLMTATSTMHAAALKTDTNITLAGGGSNGAATDTNPPEPEEQTTFSVTEFGADGSDQDDDYSAFQSALNKANTCTKPITVTVPAGTYYLSGSLRIYSNTTLNVDSNATIISQTVTSSVSMIHGSHLNENGVYCSGNNCTHGAHTQAQNVTITGGTWDRNVEASTLKGTSVISFRHASNITLKNINVKNASGHFINLSGVNNALLENVTISNAVECNTTEQSYWGSYTPGDAMRYNSAEAVHTDYCNKESENSPEAMPFDNTPAKHITVKNCTFNKVYACIGTHHPAYGERSSDYNIIGNTFKQVFSYCIYAYDFDNVTVSDNTITGASGMATITNSNVKISGNTYDAGGNTFVKQFNVNNDKVGLFINRNSNVTLTDNNINNSTLSGIRLSDGSVIKATGNTIANSGAHAVYVLDNCNATFNNNTIQGAVNSGFRADKAAVFNASGNTVSGTGEFGIHVTNSKLIAKNNTILNSGTGKPAIKILSSKSSTINSNTIKSSGDHGIVVSDSNGTAVQGNSIKNTTRFGIHIFSSANCTVSDNNVSAKLTALQVEGESTSKPGSATITNNTLSSSDSNDMRLGRYAINCVLGSNTLVHNKMSVDSTASYVLKLNAPVLTGASNVYGGVKVTWNKVGGAAKYRVFRKTGTGSWTKLGDTTSTSYTDKTANSGTKYTYTVRCITADGKTNTSDYDTTGKSVTYIAAPVISKAENVVGGVKVVWGKVTGAVKYRIFRKTGSGSWTKLADTASASYTDKTVKSGTKYSYTIRCITENGKSYTSGYSSTGKAVTYIAAPVISKLENVNGGVRVTWSKVTGAARYCIFRKTGSGSWTKLGTTTSLKYTDKTAKSGTKYSYTVRCVSSDGKSYTSSYYTAGKTITYVAVPVISKISIVTGGVKTAWSSVAGAAKYCVLRKSGSGSWTKLAVTSSVKYIDKTVKKGTKYTYTIRCLDANGKYISGIDSTGKSITYK